ncbi:MAG: hypothetical protein UY31_C0066G0001, partial [Candidatus Wolfebacteria bacterium GW2011_GWE1_48_7]
MSSSKRFLIVFALLGINALFAMKDLSFATQAANPAEAMTAFQEIQALEGTIVAQAAMPQREPIVYSNDTSTSEQKFRSVTATGYSSSENETDSTPFLTASGSYVRDGVAASNFMPFGTKFKLPKLFGDKVFTVEDRMNARYNGTNYVDIWFAEKSDAIRFGTLPAQME